MADAALTAGFVLLILGVGLTYGVGPACIVAGVILFLAGGLASRRG